MICKIRLTKPTNPAHTRHRSLSSVRCYSLSFCHFVWASLPQGAIRINDSERCCKENSRFGLHEHILKNLNPKQMVWCLEKLTTGFFGLLGLSERVMKNANTEHSNCFCVGGGLPFYWSWYKTTREISQQESPVSGVQRTKELSFLSMIFIFKGH